VFVQAGSDSIPERVEDYVQSLTASQLGGWHKIGVTGYQHDSLDEPLVGEGCDINSEFDVHAFLGSVIGDIGFPQLIDCYPSPQQKSRGLFLQQPATAVAELTESKRDFAFGDQRVMQLFAEVVGCRFAEINAPTGDRVV
jgi:hypothetical protein